MSIKEDVERTYKKFDKIFTSKLGKPIKNFQMSQVRDQFKQWVYDEDPLFQDASYAEDAFLYIYHFIELQEIKRNAIYLREMNDESKYSRFMQEFFDDNSPSGLQDLKVHQINNESDKIWFSREEDSDETIHLWRKERFLAYL
tara:strand:- start:5944 stop:6372 length:429 start_codon:yes stop_codon:yes gene_type:complete